MTLELQLKSEMQIAGMKNADTKIHALAITRAMKFFTTLRNVAPFAIAIVLGAQTGLTATLEATSAFTLEDFSNEKDGLFAHARYSNLLSDKSNEATTTLGGVEFLGAFFPNVELSVAKNRSGPWQQVESKMPSGRKVSLVLPGILEARPLKISLTPFQDRHDGYEFGKIRLPTGDSFIIPFSELRRAQKLGSISSAKH